VILKNLDINLGDGRSLHLTSPDYANRQWCHPRTTDT
jgi:hypothetical protein